MSSLRGQTASLQKLQPIAWSLFCLGFFTCTWDLLLTREINGFTLKVHQLFFFLSLLALFAQSPRRTISDSINALKSPFILAFLALVAYFAASVPRSYFPLKSALYCCWILFNIGAIWLTIQLLFLRGYKSGFLRLAGVTMLFHSAVICIDQVAYLQGFKGGLIGYNQDAVLGRGLSRPHAFSFEPSYIAAFLSLGFVTLAPLFPSMVRRTRWSLLGILLVVLALISTTSRTGWACGLFGVAMYLILDWSQYHRIPWKKIVVGLGILASAVTVFVMITPKEQTEIIDKKLIRGIHTGNDGSSASRYQAFGRAIDMSKETKWLGTGLGASYRYWTRHRGGYTSNIHYLDPREYGAEMLMSVWAQLIAEGGLPAIVLFSIAGFFLLRKTWYTWNASREPFALGAFCAAVSYYAFITLLVANIAKPDIWAWLGVWMGASLSSKS